jgi:hypothetical protein
MRSSTGLESGQQLFSKSLCLGFVCMWLLLSCCSRGSTLILGTSKDCNSPLSL